MHLFKENKKVRAYILRGFIVCSLVREKGISTNVGKNFIQNFLIFHTRKAPFSQVITCSSSRSIGENPNVKYYNYTLSLMKQLQVLYITAHSLSAKLEF